MGPLSVNAIRTWCFAQKGGLGSDSTAVESGKPQWFLHILGR